MTARRQHGEGSLFYSESAERWFGFVDAGRTGSGQRRRVKVSGRTKAEARAKLAEVRRTQEAGLPVADQRLTVAELLEQWLANPPAGVKSPNTLAVLSWAINGHLIPALGWRRLRDLTPDHVEEMLRAEAAAGMSKASLARLRNVLIRALRSAERRGKVTRNVAMLVDVPAGPARRSRSLTVEQAKALLAEAAGKPLEPLVLTGLMLGLRPGELLALTWANVDLEEAKLRVTQSLIHEAGRLRLGDTKTAASRRVLLMPAPVVKVLRRHRTAQTSERREAEVWSDHDLVFTSEVGTPLDPSHLRRRFAQLTEAAGLGHWHPHELRHSAASILSASGVPLEVIADVLGHQGTRTTSAVYRHLLEPTIRGAVGPMESAFGGSAAG